MFNELFGSISMLDNYDVRKVDNYSDKEKGLIVDTCLVTDSEQDYETGICHPAYNNGDWIIVEMYNEKEEAQKGHNKWVKIMTSKSLPKELKDISSSDIMNLEKDFFGNLEEELTFKRSRNK